MYNKKAYGGPQQYINNKSGPLQILLTGHVFQGLPYNPDVRNRINLGKLFDNIIIGILNGTCNTYSGIPVDKKMI